MALTAGAALALQSGMSDAGATAACPATSVTTGGEGPAMEVVDGEIRLATPTDADAGLTLELSTVAVHRGSTPVNLTVVTTTEVSPDWVTTVRKEVAETAQRIAGGVEQSWCFGRLPRGEGDLVVRVQAYVSAKRGNVVPTYPGVDAANGNTPEGIPLHYPGLVDAQYHHGTWIDAAGRRSPVTARFVDSAVELTVPAALIAETTFPAVLDPIVVVTPNDTPPASMAAGI